VIDGKTNKVVATITSGYLPNGVASDETYNKIYVTNSGSNNVSVINGVNTTENHYCDTK
jgi:DNA-binding beta-propeller fold protein YncE